MKLWLGHYLDAPDEWFIAWGETKMEAAGFVHATWGEPDLCSMRPVAGAGAFNFRVEVGATEDGFDVPVYVNADEGEEELAMDLGGLDGVVENDGWILERLARTTPPVRQESLEDPLDDETVPECDCFWERDVLNLPCDHFDDSPGTPGACVVCEHGRGCHVSSVVAR